MHAVVVPLVSLLVLLVPGLALGLVAGLRAGTAVAAAPLLTYGVVTTAATVASYVSFPWNPLTLVLATVLVGLVVAGVRLLTGRGAPWPRRLRLERPSRPSWRDWLVIGGVVGGGVFSAAVILRGFGRFGAPNQDWDYVFHSNAVRLISDTGNLAPAALRQINDWESSTFYYPNTFHGVAAIVRDLTGSTVFETLNAQAMIVCLVAGLGLAGLLHRLGAPLAVTATTPVLLAGFTSFPYDTLWRGPLLPYAAGVAVIPALLLLLDVALAQRGAILAVLFGLGTAGLLGLHPSCALSAAIFVVVYLARRWWTAPRRLPGEVALLALAGGTAAVTALPAVLGALTAGATANQDWPAIESPGQAVGDLILLNHSAPAPQYWLAGLLVVGILTVYRARYLWSWLAGTAVMVALFVMAASSDGAFTQEVTQPWWNDRWRFAALAVLGFAPLAAHALVVLARGTHQVLIRLAGTRVRRLRAGAVPGALAAAGLLIVIVGSHGLYAARNEQRISWNYQQQGTLSTTEVTAMQWLAHHSSGGTIMNDSNDGSAYLSAVAGLHPLFGHVVNPPAIPSMGKTQQLLLEHFNCLDSNSAVRAAVRKLDIKYVFLGSGFVRQDFHRVPGLQGVAGSPSLHLIHSVSGVQIYSVDLTPTPTRPVTACTAPTAGTGS